jgi:hypothetical protein
MEFLELMESWGVKIDNRLSRFVRCPDCERSFTSAAVALMHVCHKAARKGGRGEDEIYMTQTGALVRFTLEEWIEVDY